MNDKRILRSVLKKARNIISSAKILANDYSRTLLFGRGPVYFGEEYILDDLKNGDFSLKYEVSTGPSVQLENKGDNKGQFFKFHIKSDDNKNNWLVIRRRFDALKGLNISAIAIKGNFDMAGCILRISLESADGDLILSKLVKKTDEIISFPTAAFRPAPWNERELTPDFRPHTFSIQILPGLRKMPVRGSFIIGSVLVIKENAKSSSSTELILGNFGQIHKDNIRNYYWWGTGKSATASLHPEYIDINGQKGILRIDFSLCQNNDENAWFALKRTGGERIETQGRNLVFWAKSKGIDYDFEFYITDEKGFLYRAENNNISNCQEWTKILIKESDLIPWGGQTPDFFPKQIVDYQFKIKARKKGDNTLGRGSLFLADNPLQEKEGKREEKVASEANDAKGEIKEGYIDLFSQLAFLEKKRLDEFFCCDDHLSLTLTKDIELNDNQALKFGFASLSAVNIKGNYSFKSRDFIAPLNWKNAEGISFWVKGDSQGGKLAIKLVDEFGNSISWHEKRALAESIWTRLNISFSAFIGNSFDLSRVRAFVIEVIPHPSGMGRPGHILFSDIITLESENSLKSRGKPYWGLMDFIRFMGPQDISHYLSPAFPREASLNIQVGIMDLEGVKGCLRLDYSASEECKVPLILKKNNYPVPMDLTAYQGLSFWAKGEGNQGLLRVRLYDSKGKMALYENFLVLGQSKWICLKIGKNSFDYDENFDLRSVQYFELNIDNINDGPMVGSLYLNHFDNLLQLDEDIQTTDFNYDLMPGNYVYDKKRRQSDLDYAHNYRNIMWDLPLIGSKSIDNFFWFSSGPDSEINIIPNSLSPDGIKGCLRAQWSIESENSDKNWICIRKHDFQQPENFLNYQGFYAWYYGQGDDIRIRLSLKDKNGNQIFCASCGQLNGQKWMKLAFSATSFVESPDNGKGIPFDMTNIISFEIYFGLISMCPARGTSFFHHEIQPFDMAKKHFINEVNILEPLLYSGVDIGHFLWAEAGEDAKIYLTPNAMDPDGAESCLRADFSISSDISQKNWVVIGSHPFKKLCDYSDYSAISFWLKGNEKPVKLRLVLFDDQDGQLECTEERAISIKGWTKIQMPLNAFKKSHILEEGDDIEKGENNEGKTGQIAIKEADLKRINRFAIALDLHWQKPPISGTIFLKALDNIQQVPSRALAGDHVENQGKKGGRFMLFEDLRFLSISTLNQYYWFRTGEESNLKVNANVMDPEGIRGNLRLDYEINGDDSTKNWINMGRVDYKNPADWSHIGVISLWIRGDGQGGQFRIGLKDFKGNHYICSDFRILSNNRWTRLDLPIEEFRKAPWRENSEEDFDFSRIVSYEIYVGLDWKKPPIKGTIFINSFSEMPQLSPAELVADSSSLINLAGDLRFVNERNFPHYFWCGGGESTKFKVLTNMMDPDEVKGCMLINWTFEEKDHDKSWLTLRRNDLQEIIDMSKSRGIALWMRPICEGGQLRISLEDTEGSIAQVEDQRFLSGEGWSCLEISTLDFMAEKSFDWKKIKSWSIRIAPAGVEKFPAQGKLFINDFRILDSPIGRDDDAEKWANLASDFKYLNQATAKELFWWGAGEDANLEIFPNTIDDEGTVGCLRMNYSIRSSDSDKNWVTLRHSQFREYADWSGYSGVFLWVKGDGQGGHLRVLLRDSKDNQLICSDLQVMNHGKWIRVQLPKNHFVVPPWLNRKARDFDWKSIASYEIYLGLNWKKPPLDGTLWINDFRSNIASLAQEEDDRVYISILNDLACSDLVELSERYWWDHGPDSSLTIETGAVDPQGIGDITAINYTIETENSDKNWISLKHHDLANSRHWNAGISDKFNWSYADGISFWIRGDGQGGKLRIGLEDEKGNRAISSDRQVLSQNRWVHLRMAFNDFVPEEKSGSLDFHRIKSFDIYLGLDWKKPPIKGQFYLADLKPAPFTERTIVGDYSAQQKAAASEKYRSQSYKKILELTQISRKVAVDGKIMAIDDINKALTRKLGPDDQRSAEESWDFDIRDIHLEESKNQGKWGLSKAAVFVEPTNLCNLQCIMCNHGDNSFERPLGVMKFHEFRKIVDEIQKDKLNLWEFGPYWLGESFIHPQIEDMLSYASEAKAKVGTFKRFSVHTNGEMLENRHISAILDSRLDSILFSLDAAKKETYEKIRIGGDFDRVIDNIRKLIRGRKERKQNNPRILVQFIVMDQNVDEVKDFASFWKNEGIEQVIYAGRIEDNPFGTETKVNLLFPESGGDAVFIKALEPNALTKKQKHREVIFDISRIHRRRACGSLWRMMSIAWDGTATACCRDDQVKMPIGNVFHEGLNAVWYGEKLRHLRIAQIFENFEETPKCVDCVNWVKNYISDDEIIDWLESVGEKELVKRYKKKIKGLDKR